MQKINKLLDFLNTITDKNSLLSDLTIDDEFSGILAEHGLTMEATICDVYDKLVRVNNELYIRLYAEFDNFKKRTRSDNENIIADTKTKTMSGIFTLLDELNLASNLENKSSDVEILFEKVNKFIMDSGYTPIDNTYYSSELHEAITVVNLPDTEDNKIVSVLSNGYTYNDKVVRYSKVVVNKKDV